MSVRLTIKTKLLALFLLIALVPLSTVTYLSLDKATMALQGEIWDKFAAIQKVKKHHIESYFNGIRASLRITRDDPYIQNALWMFKGALEASFGELDSDEFRKQTQTYDPRMQAILTDYGWVDLYLISTEGQIVYTVTKQADLSQPIDGETLKDSGLAKAFRDLQAAPTDAIAIADFEPYGPAGDAYAAFLVTRMTSRNGSVVGYLGLRLDTAPINAIVQQRTGMGASGESYLVGRIGERISLRSDRIVGVGKVGAAAADPLIAQGLSGESGAVVKRDESGAEAFLRCDPIAVEGLNWAMVSTASVAEMLTSVTELRTAILAVIGVAMVSIVVLALWVTGKITRPINSTVSMIKDIAEGEGDLTKRLDIESSDEIGQLGGWFNLFMDKLQTLMTAIATDTTTLTESVASLNGIAAQMDGGAAAMSERANGVAAATEQMSANMHAVAASSAQASGNVNLVANATEGMTRSAAEISDSAESARGVTESAVARVVSATKKVTELGQAARQISKVTEVITEISEQTNLLALNATIEAARAGGAGKGFAVVATEIKGLARQTAEATEEINARIGGIQSSTTETVRNIEQISSVIGNVNESVGQIATAVEAQTTTSQEIADNVAQASQGIQEVNANVGQSSTVATTISEEIAEVNLSLQEISTSSAQVSANADNLSTVADRLQERVGRFKV